MALPLREAGARRNFAALPALARNGEKRGRSERAEEVTKRALEKCGDGSCGGAESSVRIPLFRRLILSCNPSAEQQCEISHGSWLHPLRWIGCRHRLAVRGCIHRSRQNQICC